MQLPEKTRAGSLPLGAPEGDPRRLAAPDPGSAPSLGRLHALSERAIDDAVRESSPGNFALGYFDGSRFTVFYVGRSDSDLNAGLQAWVGAPSRPRRHAPSLRSPWRSRAGPPAGLGTRTLGRIPLGADTGYTHFSFCYARSPLAAFERECRDYHQLGGCEGLDNPRHPAPPPASRWECPLHGASECDRDGL